MKPIIRGAIFYADLGEVVGSEQKGIRPVLIIQNDMGNKYSPTTIVAAISTKRNQMLPTHILIKQFEKLRPNSIIMVDQIRTIDKTRLKGFITMLDGEQMQEVNQSLMKSLAL